MTGSLNDNLISPLIAIIYYRTIDIQNTIKHGNTRQAKNPDP